MASNRYRYETGKVGEDLVLQYELTDADIESAAITIQSSASTALTVDAAAATLPEARIAQYVWTPDTPGYYLIEWHLQHSGGVDRYPPTIVMVVEPRIAD